MQTISLNDAAIVSTIGNGYRIHFLYVSKGESINLSRNAHLTGKSRTLQNIKIYYHIKDE